MTDRSETSRRFDEVNRPAWAEVAGEYAIEGWTDPGELGALTFVADRVRGLPVLDLGVGGGRTVALLRLLTDDYLGIDYVPEFIELARSRHPGVRLEVGDARDLSQLPEHSRGFVLFSFNGIDALDHEDRQRVLAEVRRVLQPGGTFVFATLNKDNPMFGARPGDAPEITWVPGSLLPAAVEPPSNADGEAAEDDSWIIAVRNWRRLRRETRDEGDWGMAPSAGHQFRLLAHFTTLRGEIAELDRHGFDVDAVFSCDDPRPLPNDESAGGMWMHFVATARAKE
jgi:SAM-dependent methyltransferase